MHIRTLFGQKAAMVVAAAMMIGLSGCAVLEHAFCAPGCRSQTHNTSSLVGFLYPDGKLPPPNNTIPELHVPLRVGLAFLPSQSSTDRTPLGAAQKQELLERIRQRFSSRPFVSEIVVIPDYYLGTTRGFEGLAGVQRLYNIDLMALVSYDQVTHTDDNTLSLAYLTILGAYILPGSSHDTATLVDLAVVDPATRSLVLRAGGTSTSRGKSTLVNLDRNSRDASASGFNEATNHMIDNFDTALTAFQTDVRSGKTNVRVVTRNSSSGKGGGGSVDTVDVIALLLLSGAAVAWRSRTVRGFASGGGITRALAVKCSTFSSKYRSRALPCTCTASRHASTTPTSNIRLRIPCASALPLFIDPSAGPAHPAAVRFRSESHGWRNAASGMDGEALRTR